jgi:hypothetical protein
VQSASIGGRKPIAIDRTGLTQIHFAGIDFLRRIHLCTFNAQRYAREGFQSRGGNRSPAEAAWMLQSSFCIAHSHPDKITPINPQKDRQYRGQSLSSALPENVGTNHFAALKGNRLATADCQQLR